ncbi:MAG: tetratricopeptide repeat protein [Myxococcaceae bacterium]
MKRVAGVVVAVIAAVASATPPKRPAVDLSAMREAMGITTDETGTPYPSAASYAHFLRARLAHHDGDHKVALDELRLALASDDQNPFLMTGLAEQYARSSELDRAELQLKKVIERFPDYQPAQLLMGRVLYEGQKTTRARTHLLRAIKLRPNDPDAYLVLTQLWLDQGRTDDAIRVVEELGAAVPGDPVGFRRLGLALAERGDGPRAEKLLLRAVERDPGDIESWATLGRIAEAAGQNAKSLEAWEKALERDPENREVLLSAGRLALKLKRTADAKAYFDEVLSQGRDPEVAVKVSFSYLAAHQLEEAAAVLDQARMAGVEPRLHFYAGLVHERVRNFQKAADAFDAVPRGLGDVSAEARLHRAICLSQLGQHKQALELLRALQEDRPDLSGLEPAMARALERAGQLKEAEGVLVRAVGRSSSAELLEALSGFYARQRRLGDAIALLSGAVARNPNDEAMQFALATLYEKKGEWQKAIERLKPLIEKHPDNSIALNFMGYTLANNGGDLDEAERVVRKALEQRPESSAFLDSLGWIQFKRGRLDDALETLERAVDAAPDEPTLLEHLAEAAAKKGNKARAVECLSRAIELLKDNPDDAERPTQRTDLERRLKQLSPT